MIDTKSFRQEVAQKAAGAAHNARPLFFISDLHLSEAIPKTVAAFEHFIEVTASGADSVFILGDLFEFWVGDDILDDAVADERARFARRMTKLLHTLTERGIALYVMHGNRDFLLGKRFMKEAGALPLPDPFTMTAFGTRIVLAHGDALCTADPGYQRFRRFARNPFAQRAFLALPLKTRLGIGQRMRTNSEGARMQGESPKYDVTRKAVSELFIRSRTHTMIHGHTHRPAMHREVEGARWVLPDWELDMDEPRGGYLRIDEEGIRALPL
ncbi:MULTISPECIES: UDP-2,3-diacylglucosamine diphosphatase [unclassified Caballeronia]|jgi:UDP-2,3-diacylglucosamine hydrolase|uniref:UDP-2,3-diacylglucosamine diphosphatase n=1 Tax=unclassified Caballeronia TaxID=2646786 RepID=UPI0020290DBC|nr:MULTISPECIES: UDP-2,3-diacylglucosamine diphosphatase [unclassified Caballeronia]MDR5771946.1 UDP-2,3-diacylglucosamine diphosphatase [Caballeronia sp. LZ002]MDR5804576.1 UDP-2,3-diacylglucosamine diphosphatase [Caballeronia sp. LZ001]MDR5847380.1 UDP-2,3-diacylglucosamine diphosphatase [Caballeronia sp. LZ003]